MSRVDCDDRITCLTCQNYRPRGSCLAASRGELSSTDKQYAPNTAQLRRCEGYSPISSEKDKRSGVQRWPSLSKQREKPSVPAQEEAKARKVRR